MIAEAPDITYSCPKLLNRGYLIKSMGPFLDGWRSYQVSYIQSTCLSVAVERIITCASDPCLFA